jgi:hypothetical protein
MRRTSPFFFTRQVGASRSSDEKQKMNADQKNGLTDSTWEFLGFLLSEVL